MPQPLYPPVGPQTIGQVLDTGFRIFQVSLVRCLLYGAAGMIAGQLPNIYSVLGRKPLTRVNLLDPELIALYVVSSLLSLIIYCALVLRQYSIVTGRRRAMLAELAETLRRFPSILGVALIWFVMAGIWVVFLMTAMGTLAMAPTLRTITLTVGFVLALLMVYFLNPLSFAMPAVIIDGRRASDAVRYGLMLVKGNWWRTAVIYTIVFVVIVAFYVVSTIAAGVLAFSLSGADIVAMSAAAAVVYVALGALGLPFTSAAVLATYGELKVRREAVDLEARLGEVRADA
ncbi:MAG TPA: hypothetical protein VGE96_02925 [Steroidobacteraceae bacterium]|jgi:hypothetical protein